MAGKEPIYNTEGFMSTIKTIAFAIILFTAIIPASALMQPQEYYEGMCELAAKDYQNMYGGDLILVQPLKDNGAYDLGEYNGIWLNKAWDRTRGIYYIYYPVGVYFNNTEEIKSYFFNLKNKQSEVFNINEVHPPFEIIYHY